MRPAPEPLLEQCALAVRAARQRQHEIVIGHAQRPFLGFVVGLEGQLPDVGQQYMRAGGIEHDLFRHFVALERRRARLLFLFFFVLLRFACIRLAHALRERRIVETCLAKLARLEFDRSQGLDLGHHARFASDCPARLIQQRRIDEQCVSASHPLVQGGEFVVAEHLHARQREHHEIATRRDAGFGQRRVTLAPGARLHAGPLQPLEQRRVAIAAPFGTGGARGIGFGIQRRRGPQPQSVERGQRAQGEQQCEAAFAHQRRPPVDLPSRPSSSRAPDTEPSMASSGGGCAA